MLEADQYKAHKLMVTEHWGYGAMGSVGAVFKRNLYLGIDHMSLEPTEQEVKQLTSFLEFLIRQDFDSSTAEKMLKADDYPRARYRNTYLFRKMPDGWMYRQAGWIAGPAWYPNFAAQWGLEEILDFIMGGRADRQPVASWMAWMKEHPDAFPEFKNRAWKSA